MSIVSGMDVYCRFKGAAQISQLKIGPRGGVYALIGGAWKYARRTRSKRIKASQ